MITYIDSVEDVSPDQLRGFFVGWPNPPSPELHLELLANSDHIILAVAEEGHLIVGFITAISDGILSAFIPLLEVLPTYQRQGVGQELMRRMLDKLSNFYSIDLSCKPDLQPYYAQFGMKATTGMIIRNYERQAG